MNIDNTETYSNDVDLLEDDADELLEDCADAVFEIDVLVVDFSGLDVDGGDSCEKVWDVDSGFGNFYENPLAVDVGNVLVAANYEPEMFVEQATKLQGGIEEEPPPAMETSTS